MTRDESVPNPLPVIFIIALRTGEADVGLIECIYATVAGVESVIEFEASLVLELITTGTVVVESVVGETTVI